MRRAVYSIAVIAAITVATTALKQDADAALPVYTVVLPADTIERTPQPAPYPYLPQSASYGDVSRLASPWSVPQFKPYSPVPDLGSFLDPSQFAFYSHPNQFKAIEDTRQSVSLGNPEKATPSDAAGQLKAPIVRIGFSAPVLAPMAHTRFCLQYPSDCKAHKIVFRGGSIKLSAERRAELVKVNAQVNRAITPERNDEGLAAEKWLISPKSGDCNDYAVTKRHELIARGWPARSLLLAEVIIASGEHHLVLVVRTKDGDLVGDNLNANIRDWSKTSYEWVRIQSPTNPTFWSKVTNATV